MARPTRLITPKASPANSDAARIAAAVGLWRETLVPGKTVVETYLAGRGLALPADTAGEAIRFHPACPFRLKDDTTVRLPTMVGLMRDILTDKPCGIHRTALKPDGSGKAVDELVALTPPSASPRPAGARCRAVPCALGRLGADGPEFDTGDGSGVHAVQGSHRHGFWCLLPRRCLRRWGARPGVRPAQG